MLGSVLLPSAGPWKLCTVAVTIARAAQFVCLLPLCFHLLSAWPVLPQTCQLLRKE